AFRADFSATLRPYVRAGFLNALTQLAMKLFAPGVPDIYQGTEAWDFSLVDPDNRRAVEFPALSSAVGAARAGGPEWSLAHWHQGAPRQWRLGTGLALRHARPALFSEGSYMPLTTTGACRANMIAFERRRGRDRVVLIAPRLTFGMSGGDVSIAPDAWR